MTADVSRALNPSPTPSRLQGAIDVVAAAVRKVVTTVEGVHKAIARKPFAVLRHLPVVGSASETVRLVHDAVTDLVYAGVSGAVTVVDATARLAVSSLPDSEPQAGSAAGLAIAAVNGFAGDRLESGSHALTTPMTLRHRGQAVAVDRPTLTAAFPTPSRRVAVFIHGLAGNESLWTLGAQRHYGNDHTSYGSRFESDLGYTALYVRYNSGLHISQNGRRLAQLLDRIVAEWPVPIEEIVLVGHSMGGLVVRSATHYGADREWLRRVRHVFLLGSPHLGAPLEKAVHAAGWVLDRFDVTQPLVGLLRSRSRGIKDLRFGSLVDEDWQGVDVDAALTGSTAEVPLPAGAAHYFIAATITRDRTHPFAVAVGDLLVREASALGNGRFRQLQFPLQNCRRFGSMHHLELLNHPDIYEQMRSWMAGTRGAEEQTLPATLN